MLTLPAPHVRGGAPLRRRGYPLGMCAQVGFWRDNRMQSVTHIVRTHPLLGGDRGVG